MAGLIYIYEIIWTITGVNHYTDISRLNPCPGLAADVEPTSVFDAGLLLTSLFHMIEWVRWTLFLTSALVGVNLLSVFYFLSINTLFGFIAMLVGIVSGFSENGGFCSES